MTHHVTPAELARLTGRDSDEILAICRQAGVPIVHGRVDRTLFEAVLRERSTTVREETPLKR